LQPLDSDSVEMKIDNCCGRTLSGHKQDFIKGTLVPVSHIAIEEYNTVGIVKYASHQGTILWKVVDDDGKICDFIVPNSLLVPTNSERLLSPQHLAQSTQQRARSRERGVQHMRII
jgi:hypothetical protein